VQFKVLYLTLIIFLTSSCSLIQQYNCNQQAALEKGTLLIHDKFPRSINDPNPIKIYERDGFWRIKGTLPPKVAGGVPNVKLDRKTCKLVAIYHTQ
jgi:hypothetical protein